MARNVLIVYAHQSPCSFNAALKDAAVEVLQKQGCQVTVSDLYSLNFKASATAEDVIGELKDPEHFHYGEETMLAWQEGHLSPDIMEEQKKVKAADLIIFQFPMYWFSVPAIMKGWIDRVLTQGFAFTFQAMYNNGIFKEKKAMLSFTTGASQSMYSPAGLNGDLNVTLWPLQNGVLHFCGFQVLAPEISYSPGYCPPEARTQILNSWRKRLEGLWTEKPLTFTPCELFNLSFQGGFMLKDEVQAAQAKKKYGLTVGHHLGKPIPPNNQIKADD
ncbi:NAD(P)H dehydrogenase [quinone] 1 [Amia ocellicauda]|uniref:NAD(P)H dehydrogenase [quinone] 1 n=2 Tax=Amia ocellicauda TaxID=2972642 RepID=UPI0034641654